MDRRFDVIIVGAALNGLAMALVVGRGCLKSLNNASCGAADDPGPVKLLQTPVLKRNGRCDRTYFCLSFVLPWPMAQL